MFPSSGYFNSIPCPYFASALCDRPYCHFKHAKDDRKLSHGNGSKIKTSPNKSLFYNCDVPVYKPTPIAVLDKRNELKKNIKFQYAKPSTSVSVPTYSPAVVSALPVKSRSNSSSIESSPKSSSSPIKSHLVDDLNNCLSKTDDEILSSLDDDDVNSSAFILHEESLDAISNKNENQYSASSTPKKIDLSNSSTTKKSDESPSIQIMGKVKRKRAKEKSQPSTPVKQDSTKEDTCTKLSRLYSDLFGDDDEDPPEKCRRPSDTDLSIVKNKTDMTKSNDIQVREKQCLSNNVAINEPRSSSTISLLSKPRKLTPKEIMYNRMVQHRQELLEQIGSASKDKRTQNSPKKQARPTVPRTCGNRIALATRQKYLNQFVDECLKLFPVDCNAAYDKALDEEESTYQKSSNHSMYINNAIRVVKRLREEQRMSDSSGTLLDKSKASNMVSHAAVLNRSLSAHCGVSTSKSITDEEINKILQGSEYHKLLEKYLLTESQLVENGFPRPSKESYNSGVAWLPTAADKLKHIPNLKRFCCRCGSEFSVSQAGEILNFSECVYHWGKAWKQRVPGQGIEHHYSCCAGDLSQKGCQVAPSHVHDLNKWSDNRDYIRTLPPESSHSPQCYALDCEMVYTTNGCELARVTVVNQKLESVYEKVVRPLYPVIDYNTRFSGLTEASIPPDASILIDVQTDLLNLFTENTILIGHSLESDLTALKIVHSNVVDTSVVFPHRLGPPKKRALRNIVADVLQKIIQSDTGGHDSREDAVVCMELMQSVIKDDIKKKNRKRQR